MADCLFSCHTQVPFRTLDVLCCAVLCCAVLCCAVLCLRVLMSTCYAGCTRASNVQPYSVLGSQQL